MSNPVTDALDHASVALPPEAMVSGVTLMLTLETGIGPEPGPEVPVIVTGTDAVTVTSVFPSAANPCSLAAIVTKWGLGTVAGAV